MPTPVAPPPPASPEIGQSLLIGKVRTNFHDLGSGTPVLLIHGSGPGVSAWANWRLVLPHLRNKVRAIAPDMAGFGYSELSGKLEFSLDLWLDQLTSLLDALAIDRVSIVGNSFGGGIALQFAVRHPQRVDRLVLMGSVGTSFPLTHGLDRVWGYRGSREEMRELIGLFAYDKSIATDELVELRYRASLRDDVQERFSRLFPAPRQRWIEALAVDPAALRALPHRVLLIHGRNDEIIPLQSSESLAALLPDARLAIIDRCGHWVQIEHTDRFVSELLEFLEPKSP